MTGVVSTGPTVAIMSYGCTLEQSSRYNIEPIERKVLFGNYRNSPSIDMYSFKMCSPWLTTWIKMTHMEKQIVTMDCLKKELYCYGPDEVVRVYGFYDMLSEHMIYAFSEQYDGKIYHVYDSDGKIYHVYDSDEKKE